jgi:hypothetical protein
MKSINRKFVDDLIELGYEKPDYEWSDKVMLKKGNQICSIRFYEETPNIHIFTYSEKRAKRMDTYYSGGCKNIEQYKDLIKMINSSWQTCIT